MSLCVATIITRKVAMPAPGSSHAPNILNSREDDIAEFIEQLKNCAGDAQLPEDEKVVFLFQCNSRQQKDVFKTFEITH